MDACTSPEPLSHLPWLRSVRLPPHVKHMLEIRDLKFALMFGTTDVTLPFLLRSIRLPPHIKLMFELRDLKFAFMFGSADITLIFFAVQHPPAPPHEAHV